MKKQQLDKTNEQRNYMEGTHKITQDPTILHKETIPEINAQSTIIGISKLQIKQYLYILQNRTKQYNEPSTTRLLHTL